MIELMLEAERALAMGLVDQAERCYWQAAESDGRNAIAIVGLARVALERSDERTALEFARKALEVDPENGAAARLVERLSDLASEHGPGPGRAPYGATSGVRRTAEPPVTDRRPVEWRPVESAPLEPVPERPIPVEAAPPAGRLERRGLVARLLGRS